MTIYTKQNDSNKLHRLDESWLRGNGPCVVMLPESERAAPQVAIVYDETTNPPVIDISSLSDGIQLIEADGEAIAVIAGRDASGLSIEQVTLIQRPVDLKTSH